MRVNRTVLLVDDDPININVMVRVLEDYECLTASSGEEAVETCSHQQPDLVLLDIMMPGIDGYETCRRLRANPGSSGMKIVLISSKSMAEDRLAGYAAGADDYLMKPFNLEELRAKVEVFTRLKTADEINDLKSSLLDLVAHEIRTPLTGILPAAQILLNSEGISEQEIKTWAAIILENGTRLMTLAERGLILCKLRTGMAVPMKSNEILFADLMESGSRIARADAEHRDLRVTSRNSSRAIVRGDRDLLAAAVEIAITSVFQNCGKDRGVTLEARDGHDRVEFSIVADSIAEGIDLEEMFAVFAERKVDGEVVGGSISLATAREIVRAHDGRLDIESTTEGAQIVGWLPAVNLGTREPEVTASSKTLTDKDTP